MLLICASETPAESITLKLMFSFTCFERLLPMKRISRVTPNSTSTSVMLMVEVIFAFKKRAADTFFLFDIGASISERRDLCKTVYSKLSCKVIQNLAEYKRERVLFSTFIHRFESHLTGPRQHETVGGIMLVGYHPVEDRILDGRLQDPYLPALRNVKHLHDLVTVHR